MSRPPDYTTCFLFDGVVESLINVYLLRRIWFWETEDVTGSCWNSWKFYRSATWRRFLWWISCKGAWKDGSSMIWQNARSDDVGRVEEQTFGKASVYVVGWRNHIWILHILLPDILLRYTFFVRSSVSKGGIIFQDFWKLYLKMPGKDRWYMN